LAPVAAVLGRAPGFQTTLPGILSKPLGRLVGHRCQASRSAAVWTLSYLVGI
jgi:hypothetical protein